MKKKVSATLNWKKNIQQKICELSFIQGPYWGLQQGDSLSVRSEELLQRVKEGAKINISFFCWEKHVVKHKKITTDRKESDTTERLNWTESRTERYLKVMTLMLFFVGKIQWSGVTEIFP